MAVSEPKNPEEGQTETTREIEEYRVDLSDITVLELVIAP